MFFITHNPGTVLTDLDALVKGLGGSGGSKVALEAGRKAGLAEAQNKVPVRTGYLRSTIYAEIKGTDLEIGARAHYAAAVEFGHRRYPVARPYIRPAAEVATKAIQTQLQKGII